MKSPHISPAESLSVEDEAGGGIVEDEEEPDGLERTQLEKAYIIKYSTSFSTFCLTVCIRKAFEVGSQ